MTFLQRILSIISNFLLAIWSGLTWLLPSLLGDVVGKYALEALLRMLNRTQLVVEGHYVENLEARGYRHTSYPTETFLSTGQNLTVRLSGIQPDPYRHSIRRQMAAIRIRNPILRGSGIEAKRVHARLEFYGLDGQRKLAETAIAGRWLGTNAKWDMQPGERSKDTELVDFAVGQTWDVGIAIKEQWGFEMYAYNLDSHDADDEGWLLRRYKLGREPVKIRLFVTGQNLIKPLEKWYILSVENRGFRFNSVGNQGVERKMSKRTDKQHQKKPH